MDGMTIDVIAMINDEHCACARCRTVSQRRVDEIQTLTVYGLATKASQTEHVSICTLQ